MQNKTEDLWQFPCDFPIKVFGKPDTDFEKTVLTIIRKYIPELKENAIEQRPSKDNKYLALTITVHATSKEQLDHIYSELTAHEQVLMVL